MKGSKNVSRADHQQERLKFEQWILGFTDGEGCFTVSFIKNKTTKTGWQLFPEFVITQGEKSGSVLEEIKYFFRCGNVFVNRRTDNHRDHINRYCVRSIPELQKTIIPFFLKNPLRTSKRNDFIIFREIVEMMSQKIHYNQEGIQLIAKLVEKMNRKKIRILESSETKR